MVHANFYVTKTHPRKPIVFLPEQDGSEETVIQVVQMTLGELSAEQIRAVADGIQRLRASQAGLRKLGLQSDFFMPLATSNQELGLLLKNLFLELAQIESDTFIGTGAQWLRLVKYVLYGSKGHALPGDIDDHDACLAAGICGIEAGNYTRIKAELTTANVDCTLRYDARRNVQNTDGNEHYVEHNGILDVQTLQGARFVEIANYDPAAACVAPTYVFDPVVTLRMLHYDGDYYPDLRSDAVVRGIRKVGAHGKPLQNVYMSDLYGQIDHANTITARHDESMLETIYWVRGTDGDDLAGDPEDLYYHGYHPQLEHYVYQFARKVDIPVKPNIDRMNDFDIQTYRQYFCTFDGTEHSIYQLGARFGTADAHDSVLGCPLPIQITKDRDRLLAKCAPIDMGNGSKSRVRVQNPLAVLPTQDMIASSMSRRGRRNEVGIALQLLTPSKQGDIVLYDGV